MKTRILYKILGLLLTISPMTELGAQNAGNRTFQFLAHRGSRFEFDENTMEAFRRSYDAGARGFEIDVRMTGDGDLILSHDESLYRTCGVDVQTEDLTTEECRRLRTRQGNPLAFCDEFCDFLSDKEDMYVEFEIKTVDWLYTQAMLDDLIDKLYHMAMAHKPASSCYVFSSFDKRALTTMKARHPDAELMLLKTQPCSASVVMKARRMGIHRIACKMDGSTRAAVDFAHDIGMSVSLWPVASRHDLLLGIALGSDCLCCDAVIDVAGWCQSYLPFIQTKGWCPLLK